MVWEEEMREVGTERLTGMLRGGGRQAGTRRVNKNTDMWRE